MLLCSATPLLYDPEGYFNYRVPKYLYFSLLVTFQSVFVFLNRKHSGTIRFNALTLTYCLFFLAVGISQFSAHDQTLSLYSTFGRMEGFWFYVSLFLFFCLCSVFPPSGQDWKLIFWGWVGVSVVVCVAGFLWESDFGGERRMASTLGNASYLGHYLLSSLLLLFLFTAPSTSRIAPYIRSAAVLVLVSALFFTYSRTSFIGMIVGGIVYGIIQRTSPQLRERPRTTRVGIWLIPSMLLGLLFLARYHTVLLYLAKNPHSLLDRIRLWQIALSGIQERPWWGWGTDHYMYVYQKYGQLLSYPQTYWYDRSHNVFLEWFVNGGVLTGIPYGAIWLLVLWYTWKTNLSRQQKAILTVWWMGSILYLVLNIDNLPNWILLLLISQYILSHLPAHQVRRLSSRRGITILCFLLMAGGVSMFWLSFRKTVMAYFLAREYAMNDIPADKLRLLNLLEEMQSVVNYDLIKSACDATYTVMDGAEPEKFKQGYGETVLRIIESELRKRPPSLYLLHKKAELLSTLSDGSRAIQTYKTALTLNSWFLPAYLRIGYEYMVQKHYQKANVYFDKAAKLALDSTEASLMKLKILALTLPEYPVEEALNAFPAEKLSTHSYLAKGIFVDTRTLAAYLTWIEQGGYPPTHRGYYERIMCAYEVRNFVSMERALHSYERTYPCLPAMTKPILKWVQVGGNPSQKLTEYRSFCGK